MQSPADDEDKPHERRKDDQTTREREPPRNPLTIALLDHVREPFEAEQDKDIELIHSANTNADADVRNGSKSDGGFGWKAEISIPATSPPLS